MFKNIFESMDNIHSYPLISFLIFFIFFLAIILWVIKADKSYINKMKNLPLEDVLEYSKKSEGGK